MIHLRGRLLCKNEQEAALVRLYLPEHIRLTKQESGCVSFAVSETSDPLVWQLEEVFVSEAAFTTHQQRTRDSEWGRQTREITRDFQISGE